MLFSTLVIVHIVSVVRLLYRILSSRILWNFMIIWLVVEGMLVMFVSWAGLLVVEGLPIWLVIEKCPS